MLATSQAMLFFFYFGASLVWPFLAVFWGKREIFRVPNLGQKRQKKCVFFHTKQFHSGPSSSHHKKQLMYLTEFSEHLSLYEMSKRRELRFGHLLPFLNFGPFYGPVLGTAIKSAWEFFKLKIASICRSLKRIFVNLHICGPNWINWAWYRIFLMHQKSTLRKGLRIVIAVIVILVEIGSNTVHIQGH